MGPPEFTRREMLMAGLGLSALALPLAGGCSSDATPARHAGLPSGSSTSSSSSTTTSGQGRGSVTFAFAGDTHFVDHWDTEGGASYAGVPTLAAQLRADPAHVLSPVAPVFARADLVMVNLETAITDRGEPAAGKAFHFRSPAMSFAALKAAGVDVVGMANNHALDYGPVGMSDTFDAIAASGMPVLGLGRDATEAFRPHITSVNGQRIAIFAATDWLEPALVSQWAATDTRPGLAFCIDPSRLVSGVSSVRPQVDTVVVFLHWGTETTHCASPEQHTLARSLIAAGADIIVGSHAHRVFGAGHVGDALVAYGLGNFVYFREDGESGSSGILLVTATGRHVDSYEWVPARIVHGIPRPETGAAGASDEAVWAGRRACSGLAP
ncbi:MAG TPA: CapA family protein [Acidimicrobiales bacterium]|nr:CapA family protein [Acidimicrobiales bacterium]